MTGCSYWDITPSWGCSSTVVMSGLALVKESLFFFSLWTSFIMVVKVTMFKNSLTKSWSSWISSWWHPWGDQLPHFLLKPLTWWVKIHMGHKYFYTWIYSAASYSLLSLLPILQIFSLPSPSSSFWTYDKTHSWVSIINMPVSRFRWPSMFLLAE